MQRPLPPFPRRDPAIGVEIDPTLVARSREYARRAGVADRVTFIEQDFFRADLAPASVVTLYLTREVNMRLAPRLRSELRPGTRVVSFSTSFSSLLMLLGRRGRPEGFPLCPGEKRVARGGCL